MMALMRFWLWVVFAHLLLAWCILWNIHYVATVYSHGWLATMGLIDASTLHVVATVIVLGLWYVVQLGLLVRLVRVWRERLRRHPSAAGRG